MSSFCNHCALPFLGDLVQLLFPEWTDQGTILYYCDRPACKAYYDALPQERKREPSPKLPRLQAYLDKLDYHEDQMDKIIEDTHSLSESEEEEEDEEGEYP